MGLLAFFANILAFVAQGISAIITAMGAVVAELALATFAAVGVIGVHDAATVTAGCTVPIFQGDIGGGRVVRPQDLTDGDKEII